MTSEWVCLGVFQLAPTVSFSWDGAGNLSHCQSAQDLNQYRRSKNPERALPIFVCTPEKADRHKELLLVPTFWFLVELVKEGSLL